MAVDLHRAEAVRPVANALVVKGLVAEGLYFASILPLPSDGRMGEGQ